MPYVQAIIPATTRTITAIKKIAIVVITRTEFHDTLGKESGRNHRDPRSLSAESTDSSLQLNGQQLLTHGGTISHQMAAGKSDQEFEKYQEVQNKLAQDNNLKELEKISNSWG